MFDLSVTSNMVVFAVSLALNVVWLFFVIDVCAVKVPNKTLSTVCLTLGGIGIGLGIIAALLSVGLMTGIITSLGDALNIGGLEIPFVAPAALMFTYPIMWCFAAVLAALSLVLVITASVKKKRAVSDGEGKENTDLGAEEAAEDGIAATADASAAKTETEPEQTYKIDEVRSIMDEISGLVDSLDSFDASEEERESAETEAVSDEPTELEEEQTAARDEELETVEETVEDEEEESVEEQTEEIKQEEEMPRPQVQEEDEQRDEEELALAERVEMRIKRSPTKTEEVEDYNEMPPPGSADYPKPTARTVVKPTSNAREVKLGESGLPMTKRHVLINRRNVVNMFSEYLKSKNEDEKQRIESSINTIIIK